jgi:hypothetical protein
MILAVDPGLRGAFAMTDGKSLHIRDMPTRKVIINNHERDQIDEDALWPLLRNARKSTNIALVERVGGLPGQSGPAAFTFGHGVGLMRGMMHALSFEVVPVEAVRWKTVMKCPRDKNEARGRASELWPEHADLWRLKKHDGRAEAAIIALYGWQIRGELPQ